MIKMLPAKLSYLTAVSKTRACNILKGTLTFLLFSASLTGVAQAPGNPSVDAGPDQNIACGSGGCTDIEATYLDVGETSTYTISSIPYLPPFPFNGLANSLNPNIDDAWSDVEDLPFDFCYFGDVITQFQVGSNGVIRFDVDPSDTGTGSNGWSFSEDLPNNANATLGEANIFTPGHDIDPVQSSTEEIGYEVLGTAPNRVLVVAYYEVPMYSLACNNLLATQMVVLYETTNVIDIYIQDKPVCSGWQGGVATLGIQNNDGTVAFVPPGRNTSDSPWTTNDEAWRFVPAGPSIVEFAWLDPMGTVVSTTPITTVCPTEDTIYTAEVTYTNCNGDTIIVSDDVEVTVDSEFTLELGENKSFCDVPSYEIVPEFTGDITGATFLWSPGGETTETITVSTSDTYSVTVSKNGCDLVDSVLISFYDFPCNIDPICNSLDFVDDFGAEEGRFCDLNGATTTYTCNTVSQLEGGEYTVTNISDNLNSGWHQGIEDHTPGDVNGRMMFVNAATLSSGEFYRRTVSLMAGEDYALSTFIATAYDTDTGICGGNSIPSNITIRVEDMTGTLIAETVTGDIPNGANLQWLEFALNFNTGTETDVQLVYTDNIGGVCGNDFVIDDITITRSNNTPVIVMPPNLFACDISNDGMETFDLQSQIPTILDGLDPADYNITFHTTDFDAMSNQNAIVTPDAYVNTANPETIYVRVERVMEETCYSTVQFDLELGEVIVFTTDLPSETIILCDDQSIPPFDATPTNQGIDLSLVTYEWKNVAGDVLSTDAIYTPTTSGIYTVVIAIAPCSETTITVEIQISEKPTLDLGADESFCDGDAFEVIPTITGDTTGITYLWSTGETSPTIIVDETGTYTLEITVGPCVVADSIDLDFRENPVVELGADFKTCPNELQTITATVETGDALTYEWYLNGNIISGETASTLEIMLDPANGSMQEYSVIVRDGDCEGTDDITISLYDIGQCIISEGLSPNGSVGFNDSLDLEFLSDRSGIVKVQIFNRLGTLVFSKTNYVNEWSGQADDGNALPTGTYFYVIDFENEDPLYGPQATGYIYLNQEAN